MTEAPLKAALVRELRKTLPRAAVVFRHEDRITAGIPDISVTWNGRTTWLEIKYANPGLKSRGIQDLTLLRLAAAGVARYVVYREQKGEKRTGVIHPNEYGRDLDGAWTDGFHHGFVVEVLKGLHTGGAT